MEEYQAVLKIHHFSAMVLAPTHVVLPQVRAGIPLNVCAISITSF